MNTSDLEEFQYTYGDPRQHFYNYILSNYPNISSVVKQKPFESRHVCRFKCNHETAKRVVIMPKSLPKSMSKVSTPLVLIPFMLQNKFRCRVRSLGRHLIFLLYNKNTKEVMRVDTKKYHLEGYNQKLFVKRVEEDLFPTIFGEGIALAEDLDIPMSFVQKHGLGSARNGFPIYLLSFLQVYSSSPNLKITQAIAKVKKLTTKQVEDIWNKYLKYRHNIEEIVCKTGLIEIPETGRCANPLSQALKKSMLEKPLKQCKEGKINHPLTGECMLPSKVKDVDIMLDKAMQAKINFETVFTHLDSASLVYKVLTRILSNYPHARFVFPEHKKLKDVVKKDYSLTWKPSKSAEMVLGIPSQFWRIWNDAMRDPKIQFIITFVSLTSKGTPPGHHANVLIYDKATNEMERFDGLGPDIHPLYNIKKFDSEIKELFKEKFKEVKYFVPLDYCPKMPVFQMQEIDEIPGKDTRGNCAVWRMWYVHVRMANPHLTRKELVLFAMKKLQKTGGLYKFIKSYQKWIMDEYKKVK